MGDLRVGMVAPATVALDIVPGDSGVDLSTVSAASILVLYPNGTEATWSATLSLQTATTLRVTHTMIAADTTTAGPGPYAVFASMSIPSGTVWSTVDTINVKGKFEP